MGKINQANLKKAAYYLKRNGLGKTWYAVRERLDEKRQPRYIWTPPSQDQLQEQRRQCAQARCRITFSIISPTYRTDGAYLREMIESVRCQTYPGWELILADATEDDSVERIVRRIEDSRVRYVRLEGNEGIAGNTNRALALAVGDYVGLLDHDDLLAENALYEMADRIRQGILQGTKPQMIYSDEDKCNGDGTEYFEPNFKEEFNLDLLLSNNYICHFLVMERELIQSLGMRPEYDGAQDYDLVLRAASALLGKENAVVHIPKVLYHWRCHASSTAENPASKLYAYEAGRRAIQDFADSRGWRAEARDTAHVGFYVLRYEGGPLCVRQDVGAVGGRIIRGGRIAGGRMTEEGKAVYGGLPANYSGYLHRAVLHQDAAAVDIRNIQVREECREIFGRIAKTAYRTVPGGDIFDVSLLPKDCDFRALSLELCRALRRAGYRILYSPGSPADVKI